MLRTVKELLTGFCMAAGICGLLYAFLLRYDVQKNTENIRLLDSTLVAWQFKHDAEVAVSVKSLIANQDTLKMLLRGED